MSPEDLTPKVREILRKAQVLVGGRRLLDYFPDHPGQTILLGKDPEGTLAQLPALAAKLRVVVLASGDPNFYGVGPLVVKVLGAERVVIHPNVTAVQAACARLKLAWQDAVVVSLHGRTWANLEAALDRAAEKLIVYTDPEHTPAAIARFLLGGGKAGPGSASWKTWARPPSASPGSARPRPRSENFPLESGGGPAGSGERPQASTAHRPEACATCIWGSRKRPWPTRAASSPRPRCGPWSWRSCSCIPV